MAREIRILQQQRRHHHDHGDARPDRGDGDGRPPGGDARRPRAADRHARGGAHATRQSVRRALHRRQQHRHRPTDADDRLVLSDGSAIALAGRYATQWRGNAGGASRQRAPGVTGHGGVHRRRGRAVHLARLRRGTRRAHRPGHHAPGARPRHLASMRRDATVPARAWRCAGRRTTNGCSMPDDHRDATHQINQGDQSMRDLTVSRRALLGGAALLAAPAIIRPARAAEQCVVGTWGGDYARLLRENIDDPILKPAGVDVVQDVGDEAPRMAKLYAQAKLPRGTQDIACFGAVNGYGVNAAGLVEDLTEQQVPNLKHVISRPAHARLRAAHLQRAGAGVQPGQRQGSAAQLRRSARSEVEGQDRHGQHRRPVGDDGRQPVRDRHRRPISTRPRSSC